MSETEALLSVAESLTSQVAFLLVKITPTPLTAAAWALRGPEMPKRTRHVSAEPEEAGRELSWRTHRAGQGWRLREQQTERLSTWPHGHSPAKGSGTLGTFDMI